MRSSDMSGALPLVVVLMHMHLATSRACVTNCYCGQLGQYSAVMICNNMEWTRVASNLSSDLQAVDFSSNEIDLLDGDEFSGLRRLTSVELQCNSIRVVPAGIFADAAELRMVDLSFNDIESLPRELFRHNARLEELYLKQNPLSTTSDSLPLPASTSLSTLDISYCGITQFLEVSFAGLKNLTHLTLVGNNFTCLRIDVVKPLKNLKRIEASDNELDCKDDDVLETVSYLKKNSVVVIPTDLCTGEFTPKNILTTSNTPRIETSTDESYMASEQGVNTTGRILIVKGAERVREKESDDYSADVVRAGYTFPAALVLIVAAIALVRHERRRNKARKVRPPMPPPDGRTWGRGAAGCEAWPAPDGSAHEYACPMLAGEPDHYSEVIERPGGGDDGYLPPLRGGGGPAAVHHIYSSSWRVPPPPPPPPGPRRHSRRPTTRGMTVSTEPLLSQPVYLETTVPAPDVIGQLGLLEIGKKYIAHSFVRVPPRPTYLV